MSRKSQPLTLIDIISLVAGIVVVVFLCGFLSYYLATSIKKAFPLFREKAAPSHTTTAQPPDRAPYIANSVTTNDYSWNFPSNKTLYAVLVSTNIVSQPCPCGFCDPSRNIAVPEHINSIGHDLRIEVSTNYLPIVHK